MKVLSLVGARPQFIKEAVLNNVVRESTAWEHIVVHSGQHYDVGMSDVFFQELDITLPKYQLNIGSGSHGSMTAAAMVAFEDVVLKEQPDVVLLYGDTNTTLAGGIVSAKLKIPVAHVEAGIRQEPKHIPEEINRRLTDRISDWLFCCSDLGVQNLLKEGLSQGVVMAGDIMYDLYLRMRPKFISPSLQNKKYAVVTLHRDFNVDTSASLRSILSGINTVCNDLNLTPVFPIHPRTRKKITEFELEPLVHSWHLMNPIGYLELMGLVEKCAFVISDSGGLQKEAYYSGKRCAVIMQDTGWRELTEHGWNVTISADSPLFVDQLYNLAHEMPYPQQVYGNGQTAERIIQHIKKA